MVNDADVEENLCIIGRKVNMLNSEKNKNQRGAKKALQLLRRKQCSPSWFGEGSQAM